jgi:hypothetical protein
LIYGVEYNLNTIVIYFIIAPEKETDDRSVDVIDIIIITVFEHHLAPPVAEYEREPSTGQKSLIYSYSRSSDQQ